MYFTWLNPLAPFLDLAQKYTTSQSSWPAVILSIENAIRIPQYHVWPSPFKLKEVDVLVNMQGPNLLNVFFTWNCQCTNARHVNALKVKHISKPVWKCPKMHEPPTPPVTIANKYLFIKRNVLCAFYPSPCLGSILISILHPSTSLGSRLIGVFVSLPLP